VAQIKSTQIRNAAINTNHLVSGIVVNNVLLSKPSQREGNVTFRVMNALELSGTDNVNYNLDDLFAKSGGVISGSLTVTNTITVSGGLVVPSGSAFTITNGLTTVSGADLLQALSGVATSGLTVTSDNLRTLTDGSNASALHTHTLASLNVATTKALSKVATFYEDLITLNAGDASSIAVPNTDFLAASDLEVYLNGQLIERGTEAGTFSWTVNNTTGVVTFHGSTPGDHLYVKWRAVI